MYTVAVLSNTNTEAIISTHTISMLQRTGGNSPWLCIIRLDTDTVPTNTTQGKLHHQADGLARKSRTAHQHAKVLYKPPTSPTPLYPPIPIPPPSRSITALPQFRHASLRLITTRLLTYSPAPLVLGAFTSAIPRLGVRNGREGVRGLGSGEDGWAVIWRGGMGMGRLGGEYRGDVVYGVVWLYGSMPTVLCTLCYDISTRLQVTATPRTGFPFALCTAHRWMPSALMVGNHGS